MTKSFFDCRLEELPSIVPLMPYNESILMPYGKLSLRFTESRHFNMIFDALSSQRIIGLVQCMEPVFEFSPVLYSVGCAGRICAFSESEDNSSVSVTLKGICRFKIVEELKRPRGYRLAKVNFAPFAEDAKEMGQKLNRNALWKLVEVCAAENKLDITKKMLCNMSDAKMLSVLAMLLPLEAREKQALLEAVGWCEVEKIMVSLLKMNIPFK